MPTKYRNSANTSIIVGGDFPTIVYEDRVIANEIRCCVNIEYTHVYFTPSYAISRYSILDLYNGNNVYTSYPRSEPIHLLGASGNHLFAFSYMEGKIKRFDITTSSWTTFSPTYSGLGWLGYIGEYIVLSNPFNHAFYILDINTGDVNQIATLNYPIFTYINNSTALIAVHNSMELKYSIYKMTASGSSVSLEFVEDLFGIRYIGDTANGMLFTHEYNTGRTVILEYTLSSKADSIEEKEIPLLRT